MKYVNYTDSDSYSLSKDYDEIIEKALNSAIANLLIDGIIITEEQKENLKKQLLKDEKVKVLLYKKRCDNNDK